jgi:hypothetical protein
MICARAALFAVCAFLCKYTKKSNILADKKYIWYILINTTCVAKATAEVEVVIRTINVRNKGCV